MSENSAPTKMVNSGNSINNTLLIGIGNEYRTDDAAGLLAARRLRDLNVKGLDIIENCGDGAELIETWKDRTRVIIIDAVLSGSTPGTIHRLEASSSDLNSEFFKFSTHLFSVPQAIYLSASLGTLPDNFVILGIEASSFKTGLGLSPEVERTVNNIEKIVLKELSNFTEMQKETN